MHHPVSSQLLTPSLGDMLQSLTCLKSSSWWLPPSPILCSSPLLSCLFMPVQSLLVLSFIWAQIPMSELLPPSPLCLTIPESEEKTGCPSWLCTLALLIRKSNCWASLVPAVQPQGREGLPGVVSSENLSANSGGFPPRYHTTSPAKYRGLTRISLDCLRSCMNVFSCEKT